MPVMQDNIVAGHLVAGADAYGGYVAGSWPDDHAEILRFPNIPNLSIAPRAIFDADCLDVEKGDATIADAPGWFLRQRARGLAKPWFYVSLAYAQSLIDYLAAHGIAREAYFLWTAHYTERPHICTPACANDFRSQADGTQWTNTGVGGDVSDISDAFLGALGGHFTPVPIPPTPAPIPVPPLPPLSAKEATAMVLLNVGAQYHMFYVTPQGQLIHGWYDPTVKSPAVPEWLTEVLAAGCDPGCAPAATTTFGVGTVNAFARTPQGSVVHVWQVPVKGGVSGWHTQTIAP